MSNQPTQTDPEQKTIFRLLNPYLNCPTARIQADISVDDYTYLFKRVLAGTIGQQAPILGTLIKKLIDELKRTNIPDYYDPDNESRVAELVSGCTFGRTARLPVARTSRTTRRAGKSAGVPVTDSDAKSQPTNPKGQAARGKRGVGKETTQGGKETVRNG